jgi:hypothetical protein
VIVNAWPALYAERWRGDLVSEAYAHPAKMARGLTRRIYDHLFAEGWLAPGSVVIDPFGGIAGTALEAMLHGCAWVGCELEPRFVALANQNLDLWRSRYATLPGFCGDARIVQGDSRELLRHVAAAGCVVSSPPYSDCPVDVYGANPGGGLAGSNSSATSHREWKTGDRYGTTPGQLGAMRAGDFAAAVASPPFGAMDTPGRTGFVQTTGPSKTPYSPEAIARREANIATSPGNLALARMDVAVSSPPYEGSEGTPSGGRLQALSGGSLGSGAQAAHGMTASYGNTDGQIGHQSGDSFWSAAAQIVAQTHAALAPGGHAAWVVKGFVRNKQLVDFPGQWRALCESAGFTTLHEHHALLTEHRGAQHTLDGGTTEMTTERKSFFRRLAERKGSPRIDWETVYCMELLKRQPERGREAA